MRFAVLQNQTHPLKTEIRVGICDTFLTRLKGWMFTLQIPPGEGKLLDQKAESRVNAAIHMFFVPYDLAVLWLDTNNKVVDRVLAHSWAPFYQPCAPARYILEVHPARLEEFQPGDQLHFSYE